MKNLVFLNEMAPRIVEFTYNAPVALRGKKIAMLPTEHVEKAYRFDAKVDMEKGLVADVYDDADEYKSLNLPTISELIEQGVAKETFAYRELIIADVFGKHPELCKGKRGKSPDYDAILVYVRQQGFKVSRKALQWSYHNWSMGAKAGYRDERNGVHVFNPAGGNPWNIHITTLNDLCKDWQQTYWC